MIVNTTQVPNVEGGPHLGGAIASGFFLMIVFVVGLVIWARVAPLQGAAIAPGNVKLDTYRKTVQHLEGGIIKEIRVREGQEIAASDVLIVLDDTQERSKIERLSARIQSENAQLELIGQELEDVEQLFGKGLARKSRLLALRRRKAELEGDRAEHEAQLLAAREVMARSTIRAPISGSVVGLKVNTIGGVIRTGDSLLSIVPRNEPLVVEVRVNPNDIDVVHQGMQAQVQLTPFNARMVSPIAGHVVWVSADILSDERSAQNYYLARVRLAIDPADLPEDVDLYPGMPAEVMLLTGERTMFEYLLAPISKGLRRAFREQ